MTALILKNKPLINKRVRIINIISKTGESLLISLLVNEVAAKTTNEDSRSPFPIFLLLFIYSSFKGSTIFKD